MSVVEVEELPPTLPSARRRVDPYAGGMAVFFLMVAGGFVLIALGKRTLARYTVLAAQTPALVSGAIAGLALIAAGAGLAVVFHNRRCDALLRVDNEALIDESAKVLELLVGEPA